jgi:hypothetical protein
VDWWKRPVGLLDDPVLRLLTDKEKIAYCAAMDYAAHHETDGIYVCAGKRPAYVEAMIRKGALVPVDDYRFEIYRWMDCIPSRSEVELKRSEARERMRRSREVRANIARSSEDVPTSPSKSGVGLEGSQLQPSRRDEAYEALGDFCYGKWRRLPQRARGRINQALGELRQIHRDEDIDLAAEIRVRGARAREWQPDWAWTPQTLVEKWPLLEKDIRPAAKLKSARGLALADQLEAQGR